MTLNYILYPILVIESVKNVHFEDYIFSPGINTQRQETAPFNNTPFILPLQIKH